MLPASVPSLSASPASPAAAAASNKRKRPSSPPPAHTSRLCQVPAPPPTSSDGFMQPDQRLPASPPLPDPHNLPLMTTIRSRYHHAVNRLFGSTPVILNAPCSRNPTSAALPSPPSPPYLSHSSSVPDCQQCPHSPDRVPSSRTHVFKRLRPTPPTPSDQVVPNNPHSIVAPACDASTCVCANLLWTPEGIGPNLMLRTAEELSDRIILLYTRFVDAKTNQVDYNRLQNAPDFFHYLISARKLRYFDPLLLNHTERKAFFLNVYNSLMIHAIAVMSKPRTIFERISMYNTAAYTIGGRTYTLNMIEHGVLRANRTANGPFAQPQFLDDDARRQCILPHVDPRIHFALNCGARSCPPVRFYEAHSLDTALDSATRAYLLDLDADHRTRTITVPKLMQWYRNDFCDDNADPDQLLRWALPFLAEPTRECVERLLHEKRQGYPFKLVFGSYDWTVNDRAATC